MDEVVDVSVAMEDLEVYNQLFKYKCVYIVEHYEQESNYVCAVFSNKNIAIDYAKENFEHAMKYYKKLYRKDTSTLDYIAKSEGYQVIMFILDAVIDNKKIVFDTGDKNVLTN